MAVLDADPGTWLIGVGLFLAVLLMVFQPGTVDREQIEQAIDRSCERDSQCTFVKTGCCPTCNEGTPMNKDASAKVKALVDRHCEQGERQLCPRPYCVRPSGGILESVAVCNAGRCERSSRLACDTYCSFRRAERNMSEEARYTAQQLNTTVVELDQRCGCST